MSASPPKVEVLPSKIGLFLMRSDDVAGACLPLAVCYTQHIMPKLPDKAKGGVPRKSPEGLDKVLFIRANQELLDRLDRLRDRERRARPGVVLSRADIARTILWDALQRDELGTA